MRSFWAKWQRAGDVGRRFPNGWSLNSGMDVVSFRSVLCLQEMLLSWPRDLRVSSARPYNARCNDELTLYTARLTVGFYFIISRGCLSRSVGLVCVCVYSVQWRYARGWWILKGLDEKVVLCFETLHHCSLRDNAVMTVSSSNWGRAAAGVLINGVFV
jgi:hypothetical protein